jgi:hypothetical protein
MVYDGGCNLDFVIPVCNNNMIIRVTMESIVINYKPKNIYIISSERELNSLEKECFCWNLHDTKLHFINEENFFLRNYGLTKDDIYKWYNWKDEKSREFGWWYQQLLKIGSFRQIKNLSDPYIVWDSDLIVLEKWDLYDKSNNSYKFAILQECAKNEFNKSEYSKSINELIGFEAIEPQVEGTFVPHHFVMHHKVLKHLITCIEKKNNKGFNWIKAILVLSNTYYRFSEYKCIATFMKTYYPDLLQFYEFGEYGKKGIRYRESNEIIEKLKNFCEKKGAMKNLTYYTFREFINETFDTSPSYIQIEHVIHL